MLRSKADRAACSKPSYGTQGQLHTILVIADGCVDERHIWLSKFTPLRGPISRPIGDCQVLASSWQPAHIIFQVSGVNKRHKRYINLSHFGLLNSSKRYCKGAMVVAATTRFESNTHLLMPKSTLWRFCRQCKISRPARRPRRASRSACWPSVRASQAWMPTSSSAGKSLSTMHFRSFSCSPIIV